MILLKKQNRAEFGQLFYPLLIEQIFMMLIGNVNVFLFSLYNDQAVAATGIADQLLSIGTMAMGIVSLGSTILFLQNAEDKQLPYIRGVARQTILLNLLLAFFLFTGTLFFGEMLISWMQTPAELQQMSVIYLRIVSSSLLFQGLSTSASALLRSYGKVRIAMSISITNTLITITGNALVILTPLSIFGEGILGISVATVITRFIGALISLNTVRMSLPKVWQGIWDFKKSDFIIGRRILQLGIPSGMENVSYNFSQTIITAVIASLGTVAVNAKIYTQTLTAIVFTISVAAGQAGQILLGSYLRQGDNESAEKFALRNTFSFMIIGAIINVVIALLGPWLIQIFTADPEITHLVRILLWLNVLYDPVRVGNEIIISSLNVTGEVRYPVVIGIMVTYLFTVPAALVFGGWMNLGIIVIWLVFILDESMRLALFIKRWLAGAWKKFDLVYKKDE